MRRLDFVERDLLKSSPRALDDSHPRSRNNVAVVGANDGGSLRTAGRSPVSAEYERPEDRQRTSSRRPGNAGQLGALPSSQDERASSRYTCAGRSDQSPMREKVSSSCLWSYEQVHAPTSRPALGSPKVHLPPRLLARQGQLELHDCGRRYGRTSRAILTAAQTLIDRALRDLAVLAIESRAVPSATSASCAGVASCRGTFAFASTAWRTHWSAK